MSHVRYSQSRLFMALTMGGTMGLVAISLLLLGGGIVLDRSQTAVGDVTFMRAMIPHHSLAIT